MSVNRSRKLVLFTAILLALALGVGIGTIITEQTSASRKSDAQKLKLQGEGSPLVLSKKIDLMNGFSAVAEAVGPAVVNISTTSHQRTQAINPHQGMPFGDDFWQRFFGQNMPRDQVVRSLGSGVLVDSKGFIVTNNHVVEGADTITVKVADGREFPGTIIGTDPDTDLAVLRIKDAKPFPFAHMGEVDNLKVGDWVVAIGSPFSLEHTVTAGIVSAKGRTFLSQSLFSHYIQTDAAINPGNSGGPLINMKGEVIGLNNFIQTRSGGNIGIGFAIPSDTVVNVYNQIIEYGKVNRGQLGVYMNTLPMTHALQEYFKLKDENGVIITDLSDSDSPAAKAGIKPGDVIVSFNGKKVTDPDDLRSMVANTAPGEDVPVTVMRDGKEMSFTVRLGERQAVQQEASGQPYDLDQAEQPPQEKPEIGLSVEDLPARVAQQLDLEPGEGILVSAVKPASLAETAGLAPNDIIVEIDGKKVNSARQFADKIRSLESGQAVVLKFYRIATGRTKLTFYTSLTKP